MATFKPTRIRIMTYYFLRSFIMAVAAITGKFAVDLTKQSGVDTEALVIFFFTWLIFGLVFQPLVYGNSGDDFSIILTDTSITGRELGVTSFDKLTFKFSEIKKLVIGHPRWFQSSRIISKNKEKIIIHPAISDKDYNQIISYLREKGI